MGMTIEEHIAQLKKLKSFHNGSYGASVKVAINTMRKYQQIEQIINYRYTKSVSETLDEIVKVVEDGNDD